MRNFLLFALIALGSPSWAQWNNVSDPMSFGMQIRTNGWGFSASAPIQSGPFMEYGLHMAAHNVRHERELRIHSTDLPSPGPFTLGKAKRLIQGDLSAYTHYRLSSAAPNSLGIAFGAEAGVAMAALRPVYVYFLELDQRDHYIQTIRIYDEQVHELHEQVHGDAGWSRGFSSMTYKAGIHLAGFAQLSKDNDMVFQRFRLGVNVDYFPVDLGMMLEQQNQWFSAVVFSYEIGASK